ncbi:DUF5753 domain-containing protein [Streptomyces sp. NPDC048665]|uniref:DUF5753 domain-containing protein n=1 Tax=Streptomyces sp. NPDC048665 TaxID=3155490 RepID=UPI00342A7085
MSGVPLGRGGEPGRVLGRSPPEPDRRRQLAGGHGPVQETWNTLVSDAQTMHALSNAAVSGMLRTADYARNVFEGHSALQNAPRDTETAVRARMKRQERLYRPGKRLNLLMHESVLWARICPSEVPAAQLDRLPGVVGMDTVGIGILPLDANLPLPLGNSFCMLDKRLVVVEDRHAELWLDDAEAIALHRRVWDTFAESAVFGADAQQVIARVRRSIGDREQPIDLPRGCTAPSYDAPAWSSNRSPTTSHGMYELH